jgi:hypothetical protein
MSIELVAGIESQRYADSMAADHVSHSYAKAYYEDFSLAVGQRDWLSPNLGTSS